MALACLVFRGDHVSSSTFATTYLMTVVDSNHDTIVSTLTTTGGVSGSTITGASGTFDGTSITGVIAPSTHQSGNTSSTFDNQLFITGDAPKFANQGPYAGYLDYGGVEFAVGNNEAVNVFATASNSYEVFVQNNGFGHTYSVTSLSLTPVISAGSTGSLTSSASFSGVDNFGTIVIGPSAALTGAVNMEGNGAKSEISFTSGKAAPVLTNFGTTDELVITGTSIPTGDGLALLYSGGKLVEEVTTSSGSVVSSNTVSIAGASSLSASSFVDLIGTNGVTIELAPTAATVFTFSASSVASFEAPSSYTGGIAPGDTLSSLETVTIAAGTASVSTNGVVDNGAISVKNGAGFTDAGSLTGTGSLTIASGGSATLTGTTSLSSITDAGTLTLGGTNSGPISIASTGTLALNNGAKENGSITGTGTITVAAGSTATLGSAATASTVLDSGTLIAASTLATTVNMEGNGANSVFDVTGVDKLGGSSTLATSFTNFGTTDEILLGSANLSLSGSADHFTESYNSSTDQLTITDITSGASAVMNLTLTGGDLPSWLKVSEVGGQVEVTLCFYPGTRIATPSGDVAVEDLQEGDLVLTTNGAMPIRWMGQSHVHTRFADPLRSLPVRIAAGALGDGLPTRDLLVSPDHAICLDGVLVQAGALTGMPGISREYDVPEQFIYYHVELPSHELMLAEGVLAESFVDNVDRMHFQNWNQRAVPVQPVVEMDMPRVKSARQLPNILRRRWVAIQAA
jgi:hypothetical protein